MPSIPLPPAASALIPSLRGVGYSLQTAIADLVDNSIAAEAKRVSIDPDWNEGDPVIAILDDGRGMDEETLVRAMRFGGDGPLAPRSASDLGRFGLGLKTASLSQARRLTVASVWNGKLAAFRWDLDALCASDAGWAIEEGVAPGSERRLEGLLAAGRGTLVLWEKVDFRRTEQPDARWFRDELALLESHLGMVFHRFLARTRGGLQISLAGGDVGAWDPFLEATHPASERVGSEVIQSPGGEIVVAGFVMPHPDRFPNEAALKRAGGPAGWNAQQGFYVYRGDRLLTAGGWLGLGGVRSWTRDAASQLARIRVEAPTSADAEWQIDVKKSVARPPATVRKRLDTLAANVRERARDVFAHRGAVRKAGERSQRRPLWRASGAASGPRYIIDREHPVVQAVSDRDGLNDLLALIERSVPIERIWLDRSESGHQAAPPADLEIVRIAAKAVRRHVARGASLEEAIGAVACSEPFDATPGMINLIRCALEEGD